MPLPAMGRYGPHTSLVERLLSDISSVTEWLELIEVMRNLPPELTIVEDAAGELARTRAQLNGYEPHLEQAIEAGMNRAQAAWAVHVGRSGSDEEVSLVSQIAYRAILATASLDPRMFPMQFGQLVYPLSNNVRWLHDVEQ